MLLSLDFIALLPHGCAIKVDHEPLAGVEGDRIGELHSLKPTAKFGTHESATGVSRVNVQPQAVVLT